MASYLVDLILLTALLFTSVRVTRMHRELVRLRSAQAEFAYVFGKTSEAMDEMVVRVRDFGDEGKQLVGLLGDRIEQARATIAEMNAEREMSGG
ncbi:hypothetical protein ACTZWT_17895 [Rhodopseudomonas sp. NSM]|uniref:hypothetical protein n=1 Tax=Rhodopseudomonas sp. NSM TaxID=3457630 RepID=UPI0040366475